MVTAVPNPSQSPGPHLVYGFLSTAPNAVVEPIPPKAMPVILTTDEERDVWMRALGRGEGVAAPINRVDLAFEKQEDAIERAKALVNGHDIELWQLDRKIARSVIAIAGSRSSTVCVHF
jgi:putative SOS response-associated peptidase YedK